MQQEKHIDEREGMAPVTERLISEYCSEPSPDPMRLREIARHANILPLCWDWGGCYAIRSSGEVVSFAWDKEDEIRVETCPRIRNIAYYQGSKRYPALQRFIPTRPPGGVVCSHCEGKGELPEPFSRFVCYCGGIGWLPPEEQT